MRIAFALAALSALLTVGCVDRSDAVDRELAMLKRKFAALEKVRVRRTAEPPVRRAVRKAPPKRVLKPKLKVVRLRPIRTDPFPRGREPQIRIGTRRVPPVGRRPDRPLRYARLDRHGNLVDGQGRIIYRAGSKPKPGSTPATRPDPHESPARRAARLVRPPKVQGTRSRVPVAPRPVRPARLRRAVVRDTRPPVRPKLRTVPLVRPSVTGRPAPVVRRRVKPRIPAPATPQARTKRTRRRGKKGKKPVRAPGPNRFIKQKMYTGKKQRAAVTLYNRARKLFVAGKHAKSAAMFQTFLRKYFDHEFADNALYWLGETAYVQHNWLQALSWFQDVVIRYPEGNKLGDAMLKSALCYAKLGDPSYAIKVLTDVESLFPGKRIAAIARNRRLGLVGGSQ